MKKNPSEDIEDTKFERDHMSSGASMIQKAVEVAGKGAKLSKCFGDALLGAAFTIMMPKSDHADGSDTYKNNNTSDKIKEDAKDLNKAKNKDRDKMKEHLEKEKEKNKPDASDDEDTKKEKEKRNECIDSIIKALDSVEFDNYDPESLVKDMVKDYKKQPKKYNHYQKKDGTPGKKKPCADKTKNLKSK